MRIAVTGSRGFTGQYIRDAITRRGYTPLNLVADVTDPQAVDREIAELLPDVVIHLAGIAFVGSKDFGPFYNVNQVGTFNLLSAIEAHCPDAKVLIASSANIYGNATSGSLDENTLPNPVNHYGISKWAMELGAGLWRDRLNIVIVRPFNYTGVGQSDTYLVPKIISHFKRREPVIELGNLHVRRDFGDVRSLVDAYVGLVSADTSERVFNVCTGVPSSITDILEIAKEVTGHDLIVRSDPRFVRPNEVDVLVGDPSRLQAALPAWRARPLRETIEWMLTGDAVGR